MKRLLVYILTLFVPAIALGQLEAPGVYVSTQDVLIQEQPEKGIHTRSQISYQITDEDIDQCLSMPHSDLKSTDFGVRGGFKLVSCHLPKKYFEGNQNEMLTVNDYMESTKMNPWLENVQAHKNCISVNGNLNGIVISVYSSGNCNNGDSSLDMFMENIMAMFQERQDKPELADLPTMLTGTYFNVTDTVTANNVKSQLSDPVIREFLTSTPIVFNVPTSELVEHLRAEKLGKSSNKDNNLTNTENSELNQ